MEPRWSMNATKILLTIVLRFVMETTVQWHCANHQKQETDVLNIYFFLSATFLVMVGK